MFPESEANDHITDKLVKVKHRDGGELWQLIHIEVQGYADKALGIIETILHEVRKEAMHKGIQEGTAKLTYDYVVKLLLNGLSSVQIATFLDLPLDYVTEIEQRLSNEGRFSQR